MSGNWFNITISDLRNGALADIAEVSPAASLERRYFWAGISNIPHKDTNLFAYDFMRAAYARLSNRLPVDTNPAIAASVRREAIVIGAVRCVVQGMFMLTAADFIAGELKDSGLTYAPAMTEDEVHRARAALTADETLPEAERAAELAARVMTIVELPARIVTGGGTATARGHAARAALFTPLSADEQSVALVAGWMAAAIPILQGASLVESGHHYIKTTYKMFEGIYRQSGHLMTDAWKGLADQMGSDLRDRLFHKACHPILPSLKRSWARSHAMKARLEKTGLKSAAIRLPALPAETHSLKAGLATIEKASSTIRQVGGVVETDVGSALLRELEGGVGTVLSDAQLAEKVVEAQKWFMANAGFVAYCAGVVEGLRNIGQDRTDKALPEETTTKAHSVRKAIGAHTALYSKGTNLANLVMKYDKDQLEKTGKISMVIQV